MPTLYLGSQKVTPMAVTKTYGAPIDLQTPRVSAEGVLTYPETSLDGVHIVYNGVKDIGNVGLYMAHYADPINRFAYSSINSYGQYTSNGHYETKIKSVSFPDLESISGSYACYSAFNGQTGITSVSFPKLSTISGRSSMSDLLAYTPEIEEIVFPELIEINRSPEAYDNTFVNFHNCEDYASTEYKPSVTIHDRTKLKKISFPKLTKINANYCFSNAFVSNINLESIEFPELVEITNRSVGCFTSFVRCTQTANTKLKKISFPKLTTIGSSISNLFGGTTTNVYSTAFNGCTALTEIHFKASVQSIIESQYQYSNKFGAPNATIYFDL